MLIQKNKMIERYLTQTHFTSEEDFRDNLHFVVPETFNFAYDVMDEWAKVAPDKLALLWTSERGEELRATYAEFKEQTDQAAAYFLSLGIGRGDKVMLILKRHYQWWISMMALCKIGAVAIPATHMLTASDIVYRNQRASVKAIICVNDEYVTTQVREAMSESPTVEVLVAVNSLAQKGCPVAEGFHDWFAEWEKAPAFVRPENVNVNEDTMLMYFTSGTSGEPKMVAHDHLYALGHLVTGVFWHNLDKFSAEKIMRMMEKYRITSFCAPPTIYRFMLQEDFSQYDLSALKYCTTAGEALEPVVFQKFYELVGVKMMEGFGQTETTMTLGTFPWVKPKPGSMGKPNPQYDVKLLKSDGSPCEDGEKGEICIDTSAGKAIGLFKGYYRDPELTEKVWHDNLYHTGDLAWRDEEGYYWFVGRADDVIKSSGYRIGPFEVESALMTHPAVVECAVTGVPDEIRGMIVKATVVLANDWKGKADDAFVKELQNHVKRVTAPYKYPRIIEFVDALPKTISGKIRRVEIRERDKQ